MPITARELFDNVNIPTYQTIAWRDIKTHPIPYDAGIYIIEISQIISTPNINQTVAESWFTNSGRVLINNEPATYSLLCNELKNYWKPNETVIYIGQAATSVKGLKKRLIDFHDHTCGNSGAHAGGYWVKLLSNIEDFNVHYATCNNAHEKEFKMLMYFAMKAAGKENILEVEGIGNYLPFANLTADIDKQHCIKGAIK